MRSISIKGAAGAALCGVAVAATCVCAAVFGAQQPAVAEDAPVAAVAASELPPLTEDIYYQGSAEPANEPYFTEEIVLIVPQDEAA